MRLAIVEVLHFFSRRPVRFCGHGHPFSVILFGARDHEIPSRFQHHCTATQFVAIAESNQARRRVSQDSTGRLLEDSFAIGTAPPKTAEQWHIFGSSDAEKSAESRRYRATPYVPELLRLRCFVFTNISGICFTFSRCGWRERCKSSSNRRKAPSTLNELSRQSGTTYWENDCIPFHSTVRDEITGLFSRYDDQPNCCRTSV